MKAKLYTRFTMVSIAIFFSWVMASAQTTISIMITEEDDQMEEQLTDEPEKHTAGYMDDGSSDLEMGSEDVSTGAVPQIVGLGFRNVQIPYGTTISNAYVQFTSDSDEDTAVVLKIWGEAAANSSLPFPDTDFGLTTRAKTTAMVTWSPDPWVAGDRGAAQQTPDISTIITEIISDLAWAAGNNISILIEPEDGAATSTTNNGAHREGVPSSVDATKAPELFITFGGSTGVSPAESESSRIYPNPAVGKLYIDNPATGAFSYKIFSVTGQLIANRDNIINTKAEVDVSEFAKGIYFVDVENGVIRKAHKLVIK